jgi:hypothetical protein
MDHAELLRNLHRRRATPLELLRRIVAAGICLAILGRLWG